MAACKHDFMPYITTYSTGSDTRINMTRVSSVVCRHCLGLMAVDHASQLVPPLGADVQSTTQGDFEQWYKDPKQRREDGPQLYQ